VSGLHAIGAAVVVGAVVSYGLTGVALALRGRAASAWLHWTWVAALTAASAQAAAGVLVSITQRGPAELTHWIYGIATLAMLFIGHGLAVGLPTQQRGFATAAICLLLILLAWRLAQTA
jgi:hypothetical protein